MSSSAEEITSIILIREILEQRKELRRILSKYKVKEPEEIEEMIKKVKYQNILPMRTFCLL
ncbi:MAG: hypothetical protein ACP5KE_01690 [Candidatus Methanodesulfokora sp.]